MKTFETLIYIMPEAFEICDMKLCTNEWDAEKATALGITGYTDGAVLCEVLFENPGEDSSWNNGDMPQELQQLLGAHVGGKRYVHAPHAVPVSFLLDILLNGMVDLHPVEDVVIRCTFDSKQGLRGDATAKQVLNCNLTAAIKLCQKYLGEPDKLSKKDFAFWANRIATFLELARRQEEAKDWRRKAQEAVAEKDPEYCMF